MKIEYTTGCVKDSIDIDGDNIKDLSAHKKRDLYRRLLTFLETRESPAWEEDLQELLIFVAERYGTTRHDFHCETCGDDVFITTLNV